MANINIYVANSVSGGNIIKYNSSGAQIPLQHPIAVAFPEGISVDSGGNIYVVTSSNIKKYDSSGTQIIISGFFPISAGLTVPVGIFVDSSNNIYVTNYFAGNITKYNSSGTQITTGGFPISPINIPWGIFVDSNGFIYVASNGGNSIIKYNSSGTQQGGGFPITFGISGPKGIFVDSGGFIYVANYTGNNITKYSSNGQQQGGGFPITIGISGPDEISVDSSGDIYVANTIGNNITKYDSNGQQQGGGFPITNGINNPKGIFIVNNPIICYSRGTKILCDSGYQLIEDLKPGDLVQTYLHGNLPIELIGKGTMINDPSNWRKCMYCRKSQNSDFEDLIVTGGHSILIDSIPKNAEKNEISKEYYSQPDSMIDDKYLIFAGFCNNFNQITEIVKFEYYHFNLKSNSDIDRRYGVWANGVLSESSFKKDVRSNLELI